MFQLGEKMGKNLNLSVPVSSGPYISELWVGCLMKLVTDVFVV